MSYYQSQEEIDKAKKSQNDPASQQWLASQQSQAAQTTSNNYGGTGYGGQPVSGMPSGSRSFAGGPGGSQPVSGQPAQGSPGNDPRYDPRNQDQQYEQQLRSAVESGQITQEQADQYLQTSRAGAGQSAAGGNQSGYGGPSGGRLAPEQIQSAQQRLEAASASGNLTNYGEDQARSGPTSNTQRQQDALSRPLGGPNTAQYAQGGPSGEEARLGGTGNRAQEALSRPFGPNTEQYAQSGQAAAANRPINNPYGSTPPNPINYDPSRDPKDALANERAKATSQGDRLGAQSQGVAANEYEEYVRSRNMADDAWQQPGGYTDQESGDILDRGRLEGLDMTAADRNAQFLTPDEQAQMMGNPRSAMDYWNPQHISDVAGTGAAFQRDAMGDTRNQVRSAYQDPGLSLDPMYGGVQNATLSGMESGVRGAYDPAALSLDQDFAGKYPMSDTEVQQHGDLGARMASSRYAALEDEAVRRGGAAGAPSLATAALKGRMERDAGIAASDAGTGARLSALGLQRDQRRQLEDMRLGAERYKTEAGTGIEFGLGRERLASNRDIEGQRISAAQKRANLAAGSELDLGAMRANQEGRIADTNLGVAKYNTEMGVDLEKYGESESARRGYERALNRQNTETNTQAQRVNTGLAVSDRVSGHTTDVANARRGDMQAYKEFLERRGASAGDMSNQAADRQVNVQNVTGNQSLNAAQSQADYDVNRRNAKSFYERNVSPIFRDTTNAARLGM